MSQGFCPFCRHWITPKLIERNFVRRNVYKCPNCSGRILECMKPGCTNFAKGGEYWDDNFCPECGFDDGTPFCATSNNREITVYTKEELDKAQKEGYKTIIVKGNFANDVKKAYEIKQYAPATIAHFLQF